MPLVDLEEAFDLKQRPSFQVSATKSAPIGIENKSFLNDISKKKS
jgi:hypothetical protein